MEVSPSPVELAEVAGAMERAFRPLAEDKGLGFRVDVDPAAPATLVTDEQRLAQVLRNLLSNAVKFTDAGEVALRVEPAEEPHAAAFVVSDTGVGIAEENLRVVFEAFQQADGTTSRRYGGTGLGLSISREISRLLGGEIRVRSTEGEGSTFTFLLPAELRPPAIPAGAEEHGVAFGTGGNGASLLDAGPPAAGGAGGPASGAVPDDRAALEQGDRVVLIADGDAGSAAEALAAGHEHGFRGLVAHTGDAAWTLAHEHAPDAVLLVLPLPGGDGLLERLKHDARTRHVPVYVVGEEDQRHGALLAGAAGFAARPARPEVLAGALSCLGTLLDRTVKRVLVVDDDERERLSVAQLIGGEDVEVMPADSSEAALAELERGRFDCVVLDLKLPGMTGFALLEKIKDDERHRDVPVIVYTGKALTRREETRLKRLADSIIVKDAASPERLLDETALHLHRPAAALPAEGRRMLEQLREAGAALRGRRVLIVDDDVRNVFALTSALEAHGMHVAFAENGREGLEALAADPDVDLVLMDVMMPEMDGYETMRAIREMPEHARLPVIALTAKAMKGDRERSIAAGASDYITKPVDVDQLVSLMRVWLYD
jgi:CheY-like chemotaxis protein